jgi:phosphatidate cytidylyltransferase
MRVAVEVSADGERAHGLGLEHALSNWLSRIVVAAILLPIVLGAVYVGGWYLFALVAVACAIALHEYWLLGRALSPLAPAGYIGGALALLGAQLDGIGWMLGGVLTTFALAFLLKAISEARAAATAAISSTVAGALWIGGGLGFLILLRHLPAHGRLALYTVLLAIWAGDTLAYLGGRLVGRHKMAPATSPGKTWEGFVFGTAATVFVAFIAMYKQHFLSIPQSIALGAILAVAGPLGDLFESLLKRDAGVKDSGSLLGGHGGMLDRLDAFFFAAPAAYFAILAFTT